MKNFFYLLLLVLPLGFVACGDDDPDEVADTIDPTVTVTSPTDGFSVAQGESFEVNVTATDNDNIATIAIDVPDLYSTSVSPNATSGSIMETVTVPADQEPRDYVMTTTVTDGAGNTATSTATITVTESAVACEAMEACKVDGQVTFLVITPASTPADAIVHVAGSFQAWNSTTTPLMKVDGADNCYCGSFDLAGGEEFKFTRGGADFADVEKSADCEEIDNRTYADGDGVDGVVTFTVAEWRDICE